VSRERELIVPFIRGGKSANARRRKISAAFTRRNTLRLKKRIIIKERRGRRGC